MPSYKNYLKIVIIALITLICGWLIGSFHLFINWPKSAGAGLGSVRANSSQYSFINPLLYSDNSESLSSAYHDFEGQLDDIINQAIAANQAENASVYFRDLNSGEWTGVRENENYTPSSMLKVVAMMGALKLAEQNPAILSQKLYYHRSDPDTAKLYYKADDNIQDGYYSVQDLIDYMIKNSDNDAFYALTSNIDINQEFVQVYKTFRLPINGLEGSTTDFMSPKSFSSIFRSLYNSSFFGWNLSEQVLNLLSQTTFTRGLVAGVPKGTVVSHKFGENTDELHDCGIVYYPQDPYLICVMTRGQDLSKLETLISSISASAWNFVRKQNSI